MTSGAPGPCVHPELFGVRLELLVVPGASRDEIVGPHGQRLRVRVTAPPEGGKANNALLRLMAKRLGLRKSDLALVAGRSSRKKTIRAQGIDEPSARRLLGLDT